MRNGKLIKRPSDLQALIKNIDPVKASVPLSETNPRQLWIDQWSRQLYVKISSEYGTGWGEVLATAGNDPSPYYELIRTLSPLIIGKDESNPREIWEMIQKYIFSGGYGVTTASMSGIDIALWDLLAKERNKPLYSLLGGNQHSIKRYISLSRYKKTELVDAVRNLLDSGYSMIKIHQSPSESLEAIQSIRKELGYDFDLMADLNCGFSLETAKDFAKKASGMEMKWIEEPIWPPDDYDSLKVVNRIIPVAAGENFFSINEFRRVLAIDALTYYQPDITKSGGITGGMDIVKIIMEAGKNISFHCRPHNGWVGIASTAHLASAISPDALLETPPNCIPEEYFTNSNECSKESIKPAGTGHGISPKEPLPELRRGGLLRFHD